MAIPISPEGADWSEALGLLPDGTLNEVDEDDISSGMEEEEFDEDGADPRHSGKPNVNFKTALDGLYDAWDPAKHPREPKGSEKGGQFASKYGEMGLVELMDRRRQVAKDLEKEKDPAARESMKEELHDLYQEQHRQYMAKGNMKAASKVEYQMSKMGWKPAKPMGFAHPPGGGTVGVKAEMAKQHAEFYPKSAAAKAALEQDIIKAEQFGLTLEEYQAQKVVFDPDPPPPENLDPDTGLSYSVPVPVVTKPTVVAVPQITPAKVALQTEPYAGVKIPGSTTDYERLKALTSPVTAKEFLLDADNFIKAGKAPQGMTTGELATIRAYTGNAYGTINNQLRLGQMDPHVWENTKALNSALKKVERYPDTLYRRTDLDPNIWNKYQVGKIVEERGFTSTSKVEDAWEYGNYRFVITKNKSGANIQPYAQEEHEGEVLFPAGTRFKILKREGATVTMEEV